MSSYASAVTDLPLYTSANTAFGQISQGDKQSILDSCSDEADGYLAGQFTLPITAWGNDLRRYVCYMGQYVMMLRRGYNPDAAADRNIQLQYDKAIAWLNLVRAGEITPPGLIDSAPDQIHEAPSLITAAQRGWTNRGNQARDPGTPFSADQVPTAGGTSPDGWDD